MQNFRPLFPAASSAMVMWTRQELKIVVYAYEKSLEGKQIMAAEKMRQKSHRIYLSEIIQSSSLGRWQKNHQNTMTSALERKVRKAPAENVSSQQNYFQTNFQSIIKALFFFQELVQTLQNSYCEVEYSPSGVLYLFNAGVNKMA